MKTPYLIRLFGNSFVENERVSPRLASVFIFVLAALLLLWRGAMTPPQVQAGIIITSWPPEYIWSGLMLTIAGLLGLGKVVNAWKDKPGTPDTVNLNAQTVAADVTAQNLTVSPSPEQQP